MGEQIEKVGWPSCGEIDIMELVGGNSPFPNGDSLNHQTIHYNSDPSYRNNWPAQYTTDWELPTGKFSDDFHVFWANWNSTYMTMGVDDQEHFADSIAQIPAFSQSPFFIIINVAVGGNWPGNPDQTTVFPQFMYVDYVRVYQQE
jgi:beta-glucanase (GH16 family)